ncbi:hypothetical protein CUMW_255890 [Citrus unshiu]|uniref:Disease resistance protein At4g27190-like leucine-rich repeats domain-containing protein n=1 Tax=Citrus unshiu TaxID=55188 RepID=A0A2H5QRX2_CITUN|nr:hypothetical protein CUMW_255890 [Citrus unshiu]
MWLECGGLPIAIVTLAKALRNKCSVSTWKDALRQLKRPSHGNFEGVLAKPYSAIELSYKYLREEELKQLFLQCSLMGSRRASVLTLLKYAIGLGILKGVSTMEEAQDKVNTLVDQLKDACLLLDGTNSGRFSMHDVVRDVAISIASRDYHVFSMRNEVDPRQWPDKKCSRISLYDNNFNSPLKIPDNIFMGMPKLKVLHFIRMRLLSLPSSIHLLTDLRTLCLDGCEFEDIRIIGKLKKLEILSLQGSDIEQLPREIGQLTQLKLLDLRNCSKLKVIAPNVLSNLSQLEELYMANCFIEWEHLGLSSERSNASLVELKNLSRLTTLEINILDAGILPSGFFSRKLERYRIVLGNEWDRFYKYNTRRTLKLNLKSRICLEEWRGMKNVEYLCLGELQGLTNVLHDLDGEGFAELKHLNIRNNPNFLCIVDPVQVRGGAFPMLESLVLQNLINLERICHGQLLAESFCNLKTIEVGSCDKLKILFSFSIAKFLPQLETIKVIQCKNIEEIFVSTNEEAIGEIASAQVRFLILRTLPLFTSFSTYVKSTSTVEVKHNEIILENENQLYNLPSLFNEKLVLPDLEVLEVRDIKVAKIQHNQLSAAMSCNVQNLTRLILEDFCKLRYVFSYSTAKRLVQLQHLEISRCPLLEEIVGKEGGVEADPSFVFPRLTTLQLSFLPELRAFYPGMHTLEFPILTKLKVSSCGKLESFSSKPPSLFNEKLVLPNLEVFEVRDINVAKIWHNQLSAPTSCNVRNLTRLVVSGCDKLKYVFSSSTAKRLGQLQHLEISRCPLLEEIVGKEGGVEADPSFVFPRLTILQLSFLPELRAFYPGIHTLECPTLTKLKVYSCGKLESFSSEPPSLFNEKLVLPDLEVLEVRDINVAKIWHNQLSAPTSCNVRNLTRLVVSGCVKLKYVFSSSTAKRLGQLQHLEISRCPLLEEIVGKEGGVEANPSFVFPRLTILQLSFLPELRAFYPGIHTLELPILTKLKVSSCGKLEIFSSKPPSLFNEKLVLPDLDVLEVRDINIGNIWHYQLLEIACNVQKLTRLIVEDCCKLRYMFSYSTAKRLGQLQHLKISRCPLLEEIVGKECGAEADPSFVFPRLHENNEGQLIDVPVPVRLPLFLVEKSEHQLQLLYVLPNLEVLRLSKKDIVKIWQGPFPDHLSNKLKHLWLWEQNSKLNTVFQNLETLYISFCLNLTNLMPSSTSFRCLRELEVRTCEHLINLVASSTAKNLVQLVRMTVRECNKITELVVASEGDAANDEIIFPKLMFLKLHRLQSLTTFCSANYTFKFPSLSCLLVDDCPKMKIFCGGVLSAPKLKQVRLNGRNCWDGDLNTTIQLSHYKTTI